MDVSQPLTANVISAVNRPPATAMSRASSSAASSSSLPSYSASRNYAASLAARAEDALPGGGPRFVRQASFADDDLHYACRVGDLTKIRKYLDAKPGLIMLKDGSVDREMEEQREGQSRFRSALTQTFL